jgi:hypothetical protein
VFGQRFLGVFFGGIGQAGVQADAAALQFGGIGFGSLLVPITLHFVPNAVGRVVAHPPGSADMFDTLASLGID